MAQLQCQSCGAPMNVGEPIPRDAECDSCRRDLRSCRNCRHYDVRYNNACRETMADPVEDKNRRNFCEYFSFNSEPYQAAGASGGRQADARKKLDALFGGTGGSGPGASESAKQKLDSMLGGRPAGSDRVSEARDKLDALFRKPTKPKSEDPDQGE